MTGRRKGQSSAWAMHSYSGEVSMPIVHHPERPSMIYVRLRQGSPTRDMDEDSEKTNGVLEEGRRPAR